MSKNSYKGWEIYSWVDPYANPADNVRYSARREVPGGTKSLDVAMTSPDDVKPWIDRRTAAETAPAMPKVERTPRMVMCSCGHEVEAELVMSASRGTSCPDCYDRMSD